MTEVLSGLRRELSRSALTEKTEEYREYLARLDGSYVDIRGDRPDLHHPDPARYPETQGFGEAVRASDMAGICYDSVRHPGGENWVGYRPRLIGDVRQARHFRVVLRLTGKAIIETLS
ncbi:hypothetical protein LCGC14_2471200 [marine sediment metagenome]|uniref:RES domain-containing protein n=1 Tax=marine sediment metagenome TaxID=412755 RepID=A0A0F9BY48_9ZZZZ